MAATKIQAGFKGKKARDEVKMMKEEGYTSNNQAEVNVELCEEPKEVTQEEEIDILSIGGSIFHFRPWDFVKHNPLYAIMIIPALIKELTGIKTQ